MSSPTALPKPALAPPPLAPVPAPKPAAGFLSSLGYAYDGLLHALSQRNMKIHMVAAVLVGLVGSGIPLGMAERVTLIFCVLLVFFAEILNTALEALVDLHTSEYRPLAKITKDTAAAGVLVLASGTVVIFAVLLVASWPRIVENVDAIRRQVVLGLPFTAASALLLVRRRRSRWVSHLVFGGGLALWVALWEGTTSIVFTSLLGLLLTLCWRASAHIHARLAVPAPLAD
jgi:diacylglycerol kinase (ATP)